MRHSMDHLIDADTGTSPAERDASPLLTVAGLSKRYNGAFALTDVSFALYPGEIVALLGPNGAGKTTTLKLVAGLLRPDAGTISVAGVAHRSEAARNALAYIPEQPALFELLTVWEHLAFTAQAYSLRSWEERALQLLHRFELFSKRYEIVASLSKGMRQKVMIACALLRSASVFLYDEPVVGLDPAGTAELTGAIREQAAAGAAILVSTHQLSLAERLCHRVLVLQDGRLVAAGKLDELRRQLALEGRASLEDVFFALLAGANPRSEESGEDGDARAGGGEAEEGR